MSLGCILYRTRGKRPRFARTAGFADLPDQLQATMVPRGGQISSNVFICLAEGGELRTSCIFPWFPDNGSPPGTLLAELGLHISKSDQQLAALIPKRQPPAPEAFAKGDHLGDFLKFRSGVETRLKAVVRNPAAQ